MSKDGENSQLGTSMPGMLIGPHGDDRIGPLTSPCSRTPADMPVVTSPDADGLLIRRCRAGDLDAFGLLVARHERRVHALVSRVLGGAATPDDVDDTTQDIFVQAWHALPRFRGEARFSTWLYRIATNMSIKQWHRSKRGQAVISEEELPEATRAALAGDAPAPEEEVERRARDQALRTAIEALPEKQRTVVLLHYFEEHSCEEISEIIGCSVGTVWSRLHYACRKLRGTLAWLEQP